LDYVLKHLALQYLLPIWSMFGVAKKVPGKSHIPGTYSK